MATILVVDDMAIFRDPLAAMLTLAGHETLIAVNGQEAVSIIETRRVDLVLLDLAMPVMDGITFLDRLRAGPRTAKIPVIMLTAVTDRGRIVEAANRGVREYLLKSQFSRKELLARVDKLLAETPIHGVSETQGQPVKATAESADSAPPADSTAHTSHTETDDPVPCLLTREQSMARADKSMQGTTLSGVVSEVISLAASPRADLSSLASLISRDAVLAAKVLRVANSAVHARTGGSVVDIHDAIKRIGWASVRNIAATLGIYGSMPSSPAGSEREFMRCWRHALAVANLCEQLTTKSTSPEDASVAYLVGLCHDLSEILLHSHFQSEYVQVLEYERRTGECRDLLERRMIGVTHHDLITVILGHIGLPEKIRVPIQAFHDPNDGGRMGNHRLSSVLRIADAYANCLMLGSQSNCNLTVFTRDECRLAVGAEDPAAPDADRFRSEILAQTAILARLTHSAERELAAPVFPRAETRVLLVRDSEISSFNPVSAFLHEVADVRVQDRLPSMPEAAQVDCLVVLSNGTSGVTFSIEEIAKLSALSPCFWAVSKIGGVIPDDCPVQPRACPVNAVDLASFVRRYGSRAGKAAA